MNDLIGGHVDFFCEQAVSVTGQIASGAIKAYAVSSPQRLATLPDVPTAKELGVDYADEHLGRHLRAEGHRRRRSSTSSPTRSTSRSTIRACRSASPISAAASRQRTSAAPAKFDAFVKAEIARWSPILKAAAPGNELKTFTTVSRSCARRSTTCPGAIALDLRAWGGRRSHLDRIHPPQLSRRRRRRRRRRAARAQAAAPPTGKQAPSLLSLQDRQLRADRDP